MRLERNAPVVIAFAIVVVSFAAILIRLCDAPTAIIALYRMVFASLILLPPFVRIRGRQVVTWRQAGLCAAAGLFLSLHFLLWIESLKLTTVASSVMLVTTSPVFAAVFAWLALREAVGRKMLLAIFLCVVGSLIISRGSANLGPEVLKGNILAILGAAAFGAQFVIARYLRRTMGILQYAFITYTAAAMVLIGWAAATGDSFTGFASINYLWFFLLALGPQVFGHTSLSWALRYLPASKVAISILGEPVGSSLLAWAFFNEVPGYSLLVGGALILYGVYLAITEKAARSGFKKAGSEFNKAGSELNC